MKLNWPAFRRYGRRLVAGKYIPLRSLAVERRILCGEERRVVPPAFSLPGEVKKVLRLSPWRSWDVEEPLLCGRQVIDAPTVAYALEDVEIFEGCIYKGAAREQVSHQPEQLFGAVGDKEVIDEARLISTPAGCAFFGHFLMDDMPLALIETDTPRDIALTCKFYEHAAGYRALLGVPAQPLVRHAFIRRLTIYTDYAQNSFKHERYVKLRDRLRANCPESISASRKKIFLRRGDGGEPRCLINQEEIEELLVSAGFEVVDPAILSATDVADRTMGADVVIGVEGSHLSHVIYTIADRGLLLVIQPPDRFSLSYKEFTDRVGIRYAFVVGSSEKTGFRAHAGDLFRTLDLCLG